MATKAAVTIEESTPLAEIAKRPDAIQLMGHAHEVLEEMTVHARNGYRPFRGVAPTYYERTGMMAILLQLGNPMPLAVQRAAESVANEQRKEAIQFEKRVQEEAARRVAAQIQADQEARIAAAEAVANAAVEKIKADVAAERARIEAAAQQ